MREKADEEFVDRRIVFFKAWRHFKSPCNLCFKLVLSKELIHLIIVLN